MEVVKCKYRVILVLATSNEEAISKLGAKFPDLQPIAIFRKCKNSWLITVEAK